jgi:predicted phosphodiesterase
MNKAKEFRSILFVGDMHLTEKRPLSRTDHWMQAQKNKLDFIKKTAEKNNSIIVSVGDVFDTTRNSNYFLAWCIVHMPKMLVVPGNHDLPGNAMENYQKSPLNVLEQAGVITVLDAPTYLMDCVKIYPMPWGIAPEMPSDLDTADTNIAVMHYPLYENEVPFWHKDMAMSAKQIRKKLKGFDYVVAGDIHEPFLDTRKSLHVLNCGSMMRRKSNQKDYKPAIWLLDDGIKQTYLSIKQIYFDIQKGVVTDEHIAEENQKNDRLYAFLERFNQTINVSLNFEETLERYLAANNVEEPIRNIVQGILEKEELV